MLLIIFKNNLFSLYLFVNIIKGGEVIKLEPYYRSEYFNQEINSLQRDSQGNIIDDEDERDQAESKRQQRLQSEVKRRKKSTLPKNSPGNKNIPKNHRKATHVKWITDNHC